MIQIFQLTFEAGQPGVSGGTYTPPSGIVASNFYLDTSGTFNGNSYYGGNGNSNSIVLNATNAYMAGAQSNNDGNGGNQQLQVLILLPINTGNAVSACFRDTASSFHNTDYSLQLEIGTGLKLVRRVGNTPTQLGSTIGGTAAIAATLSGVGVYVECNVWDSLGVTNIVCYVQLITGANAGQWINSSGSLTGTRTACFTTTDFKPHPRCWNLRRIQQLRQQHLCR